LFEAPVVDEVPYPFLGDYTFLLYKFKAKLFVYGNGIFDLPPLTKWELY